MIVIVGKECNKLIGIRYYFMRREIRTLTTIFVSIIDILILKLHFFIINMFYYFYFYIIIIKEKSLQKL